MHEPVIKVPDLLRHWLFAVSAKLCVYFAYFAFKLRVHLNVSRIYTWMQHHFKRKVREVDAKFRKELAASLQAPPRRDSFIKFFITVPAYKQKCSEELAAFIYVG